MNNKILGTQFEIEVCSLFAKMGYWVHFIVPDARGAQPFDVIAVKHNTPYAIECKTLTDSRKSFSIDRLEDNQLLSFERWLQCGNSIPIIAIKYENKIYCTEYTTLRRDKIVKIDDCMLLIDYLAKKEKR